MSKTPLVGKILRSHYKLVKFLGGGGFGDTYLAQDLDLPGLLQRVVKHFKPKNLLPAVLPIAKNLFDREAQILYQLGANNDQIPQLFAHFEEDEEFYLVQEFIDGHDLSREITPGLPTMEKVVFKLLKDILEVLAFVHQHNVIHRDIKPQNLMRRHKDGKIVLIDFGSVKQVSALETNAMGQTSITVVVGSNGYMPSEQSNGHPKLCSDIYAVGMIGIFALTGVLPHQLKQDSNTLEVIWRTEAIVSDALASVLSQMVRYDFSKRYQSAAEAMHALVATERVYTSQPLLSSDPSGVMIPPPPPDSGPWMPTQLSATKSERRQLRLQVHRAMFLRTGQECYFLNLTNLSLNREIEVTHIWLESEPQVHIINYYRPLPKRLKLDEVWETWIEVEKIPISIRDNPYNLFKARLSSGKVVTSTQNKNVPSMGTVPGGPVG